MSPGPPVGDRPIMARITGARNDGCMIEAGRQPGVLRMTEFTIVAALDMRRSLPGCDHAVVARRTIRVCRRMVESRRKPAVGHMAGFAVVPGWKMIRILAHGSRPIVAVEAIRCDT